MKPNLLVLAGLILGVMFFFSRFALLTTSQSWAVCPQQPNDNGLCDTLYVEIFPDDRWFDLPGPNFVRFPIYVTHDIPSSQVDSIAGFVLPLCYEHSNMSAYCSLSNYWNNTVVSGPTLARSIFRNLIQDSVTIHNWMLDLYEQNPSYAWANRMLALDGTSHFWFTLIPTTQPLFGEESRALLATMTFKVEDTTTICVDSCCWPPECIFAFARMDAVTYTPRLSMPCGTVEAHCGDSNGDRKIDLSDLVYLINYLYKTGDPPVPLCRGDANCDGGRDLVDVIVLINFLYKGGSPPCLDCCAGG